MPIAFFKVLLALEAAICFGPVVLVLLLGTLFLPMWITTIFQYLSGTLEIWDPDRRHMPWSTVWPTLVVICGYIGLIGLFRVLRALMRREIELERGGAETLVMVLIGIFGLTLFNVQFGVIDPREDLDAALVYWILPGIGSAHLLYLARAYLFHRQ